jgi:imidazoleglycerol-phosphate dehydratase
MRVPLNEETTMKIAFLLYDGFSTLDFASLYEPITALKTLDLVPELSWDLCALTQKVLDSQGLDFKASSVRPALYDYDLVAVPGGAGAEEMLADDQFLEWLKDLTSQAWIASVGKGTLLLAAAGLLQGKQVATEVEDSARLGDFGALPQEETLVEDDAIFTAASSASALKLGITLCAQLAGLGAAEKVRNFLGGEPASAALPGELVSEQTEVSSGVSLRFSHVSRQTTETRIEIDLELDGSGKHEIETGVPFLDHMLAQLTVHGLFDLEIKAEGDLQVDAHHTVEDVALALGQAFRLALGDRDGIARMGTFTCPMDESLARVSVDFSGRPYAVINTTWHAPLIGSLPVSLIDHFLHSFSSEARCNLHAKIMYGEDDHHQAEALFKALGRALDIATGIDPRRAGVVPSTKGKLF